MTSGLVQKVDRNDFDGKQFLTLVHRCINPFHELWAVSLRTYSHTKAVYIRKVESWYRYYRACIWSVSVFNLQVAWISLNGPSSIYLEALHPWLRLAFYLVVSDCEGLKNSAYLHPKCDKMVHKVRKPQFVWRTHQIMAVYRRVSDLIVTNHYVQLH